MKNILFNKDIIQRRVQELGRQISLDYSGHEICVIVLLKGAFMFASDLIRSLTPKVRVEFMKISSYAGQNSTGLVKIDQDIDYDIHNRHVLILEDIVDTGLTLHNLLDILYKRNPASIEICSFLDKPSRREVHVSVKYIGFVIENVFVVGYGMDYNQMWRQYPDIQIIEGD
ncbi:MAG: hypoxanthine phosphoribosyltransferase [Candidatus Magnetoglobus multicellularis str. Araruama]|uniref:Hypoxanthine phosphoribosyltransferase n=1 Tax=Candidatus Magnetoglobus multicellularis str. Araruama TaxID=890399 RepID=A0A1V1P7L0_9BACT|nr:MAG: hypoxanthine phosphoribosyltransferase [Candidatus Magnetoglobus multicellularis str. Araruama]